MSWAVAAGYAVATLLLVAAGVVRADPRTLGRLGERRPTSPRDRPQRRGRVSGRRREMETAVPDLLDVVALSVTAGLTPRLALERGRQAVGGPLAEELERAAGQVALGQTWRTSLRDAAARSNLDGLRRLAVTLERSQRLGAPVAEQLRSLAADVRAERYARAEERARRAPVLMLFPLVFCILPAFVVSALLPIVLVAVRDVW